MHSHYIFDQDEGCKNIILLLAAGMYLYYGVTKFLLEQQALFEISKSDDRTIMCFKNNMLWEIWQH